MADDSHPIRRRNFLMGAGTALAASLTPEEQALAAPAAAPAAAAPEAGPFRTLS